MRSELKKVKVARYLSEETTAFAAQLWVDGEYIADVSNDGHGGNNRIMHRFGAKGLNTRDKVQAFEAWCKDYDLSPCCRAYTTYSEGVLCCKVCYEEVAYGGMRADFYISLMLEDYEKEKQVKRWCKTKTVITLKGDKPGDFHTYKRAYDPEFAQRIRNAEPELVEILNERYL